jgi:hypothetical protein
MRVSVCRAGREHAAARQQEHTSQAERRRSQSLFGGAHGTPFILGHSVRSRDVKKIGMK